MFEIWELLWLQNYWLGIAFLVGGFLTIILLIVAIKITLLESSNSIHISEKEDNHV
jgi:hypothetical protein